MADAAKIQEEEVVQGRPQARRLAKRRHEEILAPPASPVPLPVRRRAKRGLLLLLAFVVLMQPLSIPLQQYLNHKISGGTEVSAQWATYVSGPAPDVLFLGPSEARTDVDTNQVAATLSAAVGRTIRVGKIGVSAEGPAFIDALMYKVMRRASRPRLIVLTLETPMLNPNFVCQFCQHDPLTSDLWQVTNPTDPGFFALAFRNDPNRARLVAGWLLPAFANYPSLAAFDCPLTKDARKAFAAATGSIPWELQAATPCEVGAAAHPDQVMTPDGEANVLQVYERDFISNYAISPTAVAQEQELVRRALDRGTQVVFLKPPFHSSIRSADADAEPRFQAEISELSSRLSVPVLDLSDSMPDDFAYWQDPLHLNRAGATALAPRLAATIQSSLPSS